MTKKKALNWIGFISIMIVALALLVPTYSFKDGRWDGLTWLLASIIFLIFAGFFARTASKSL